MPFADGTHAFGIPDSPVEINSVTYGAEEITLNSNDKEVVIANADGEEIGARYIKQAKKGTAKLQLATDATPMPTTVGENPTTGTLVLQTVTFYINSVSVPYVQAGFTYVNIGFTAKRSA